MQGFASWEAETTATTALYPGSVSAIPLATGANYAWQVTRDLRTSGGSQSIASPVWWFRMAGATNTNAPPQEGGDIGATVQLRSLGDVLGLGALLAGFRPTGQIIVDGKPMSAEYLEALLRAILSGDVAVHSVTVR